MTTPAFSVLRMEPDELIRALGMQPHPEGGHYVELWADPLPAGGRPASTHIYYLLRAGEFSHWHRVSDAAEIWHFYAGAPLDLGLSADGRSAETKVLGLDIAAGERPHLVVPANWWQMAHSTGAWTLVGCTVAPGFTFSSFEMAPPGWQPGE